jgi:hypothetical protein
VSTASKFILVPSLTLSTVHALVREILLLGAYLGILRLDRFVRMPGDKPGYRKGPSWEKENISA